MLGARGGVMDARFSKQRYALVAVLLLLALSGCSAAGEKATTTPSQSAQREVTGFVFAYGVHGGRNVLDTRRGTFTKDMIAAPALTVPLRLTDEEMARIVRKMEEIDLFSYPSVFAPKAKLEQYPFPPVGMEPTYRFEVQTAAGTKSVEWTVTAYVPSKRARGLLELAGLIEKIIEAKPEYKALPAPEGGYY